MYHPTILATVNSLAPLGYAMLRPGRFDDIFTFNLPNANDRKRFIDLFLAQNTTTLSPEKVLEMAELTEGFSQAYLKDFCLRLAYDEDIGVLFRRIGMTRDILQTVGLDEFPRPRKFGGAKYPRSIAEP